MSEVGIDGHADLEHCDRLKRRMLEVVCERSVHKQLLMALCAACDRCRSSKTRCDRQRPCGLCKQKYMMTHNLTNVNDIKEELFGCVYSPAKRRGPVPARSMSSVGRCRPGDMHSSSVSASVSTLADVGACVRGFGDASVSRSVSNTSVEERLSTNKQRWGSGTSINGSMSLADTIPSNGSEVYQHLTETDMSSASSTTSFNGNSYTPQNLLPPFDPSIASMQQRVLSNFRFVGMNMYPSSTSSSITNIYRIVGGCTPAGVGAGRQHLLDVMATAQNSAQQQLAYVQQLQLRLQIQAQEKRQASNAALLTGTMTADQDNDSLDNTTNRLLIREDPDIFLQSTPETVRQCQTDCDHPDILKYLPLLQPTNRFGMHLRACYTLAFGGLLGLPPIPTDEEYCRQFGPLFDPSLLPLFDVAALRAAQFVELAMGALTCIKHRDMTLVVALTNASVLSLRNCADEKVHPSLMMNVARAYFFHAILRAHLDDMKRYFEYRRICLTKLAQLDVSGLSSVSIFVSYLFSERM